MISLISGGLLFIASLYLGVGIRAYHRTRKRFYEELLTFNRILGEEISYLKTPVKQIVKDFITDKKGELSVMLAKFLDVMETEVIYTADKIAQDIKTPYVTKEECRLIGEYFCALGKSDAATQMLTIKHYGIKFEEIFKKAREEAQTTGELAYKLGILIGIGLMIIVA